MRRPDDKSPDPPGGRAAERLREFRKARFPEDKPAPDETDSGNEQLDSDKDEKQQRKPEQSEP